mmetsp:Transcript_21657/g.29879  ORF Transcript_21657/g.29879 Transcript_21657/m.29879 type:complete len:80 (+) Transcript_21657:31-270(+)
MWQKDKILIKQYRDCMNDLIAAMKQGEEVDLEGACIVESEKLSSYTGIMLDAHYMKNPSKISGKRAEQCNPTIPYNQNF